MRYTPLATVKHRVHVGQPLEFNVFNDDRTLLLAKGQTVDTDEQLGLLFERGTLVDLGELYRGIDEIRHAPADLLPMLWQDNMVRVAHTLQNSQSDTFLEALDEVTEPVVTLINRDPDLAIFQVLRQEGNAHSQYGLTHAIHCAVVCRLVAQRLAWTAADATLAFKAALTMNLAMLELQGVLATQTTPPTDEQRRLIHSHPVRSREMLLAAGVTDIEWLRAVEEHHEQPDGSGYPLGIDCPSELATLLNRCDLYLAKLSGRNSRGPIAADRAGREMFMRDPSNPITAALVKEFGVFPPGCFVTLASGETGIVVRRGPTVMAPVVAVMTTPYGATLSEPIRRDSSLPGYGIVSVLTGKDTRLHLPPEKLVQLAVG